VWCRVCVNNTVYWHGIWGFKSEEIYMKVHMTHGTEMHGKIFNPTQHNRHHSSTAISCERHALTHPESVNFVMVYCSTVCYVNK
jgi:hypothetical protein